MIFHEKRLLAEDSHEISSGGLSLKLISPCVTVLLVRMSNSEKQKQDSKSIGEGLDGGIWVIDFGHILY